MNTTSRLVSLFLVPLCLVGCAALEPKDTEYQVIHAPALHSEMQRMANSLGELGELYFVKDLSDAQLREKILNQLGEIDQTARGLGGGDIVTNYSVLNQYMGAFLYDVSIARQFANRQPPNFVPAFRLMHSCRSCHESM